MSGGSLRIGVIGPPWFEIPPRAYGGIEWLCYWLVEGLITRGHDVTLIARRSEPHARSIHLHLRRASQPTAGRAASGTDPCRARGAGLDQLELDVIHDHSFADHCPRALAPSPPW